MLLNNVFVPQSPKCWGFLWHSGHQCHSPALLVVESRGEAVEVRQAEGGEEERLDQEPEHFFFDLASCGCGVEMMEHQTGLAYL